MSNLIECEEEPERVTEYEYEDDADENEGEAVVLAVLLLLVMVVVVAGGGAAHRSRVAAIRGREVAVVRRGPYVQRLTFIFQTGGITSSSFMVV